MSVEHPEPRPERPRSMFFDQTIRSHSIRAAATFLATVDDASNDDLFALAKRIERYIEGRRGEPRG